MQHISLMRRWIRVVAFFGKWTHTSSVYSVGTYLYASALCIVRFLLVYFFILLLLLFFFLLLFLFSNSSLLLLLFFFTSAAEFIGKRCSSDLRHGHFPILFNIYPYINPLMRLIKPSSLRTARCGVGWGGNRKGPSSDRDLRRDDDKVQIIRVGREKKKVSRYPFGVR